MVKYILTYQQYSNIVNKLIDTLKKSYIKFDWVYGIPRGGLPLAVELSHKLNIPLALDNLFRKEYRTQSILLVDDLVDTGETMRDLTENIFNEYEKVTTAVLFRKPWCKFHPDYYVEEIDRWIVFPYEDPSESVLERCETAMNEYNKNKIKDSKYSGIEFDWDNVFNKE